MNSRFAATILIALSIVLAGCSTGTPIPTPSEGTLERDRYLVDPRLGFETPSVPVAKRFEKAVALLNQGRVVDSERRFSEIAKANPEYRPAVLALARIAYDRAEYDLAQQIVDRAEEGVEPFLAAEIYRAEIAIAQGKRDVAYKIYRSLEGLPQAPVTVGERVQELQKEVFEDLFTRAAQEPASTSIDTLREALTIRESQPARILLAQRLVQEERYDEARASIAPLADKANENDDVLAVLADIDMSRSDYQSAIGRYDRLARRHPDGPYLARLREAKERFNAANMPPQYRKALETGAINRADLAVLIYWKVSAVRFATNVGQPPIAVDLSSVPGREELIRSLALGFFSVDPITRTVDPYRTVSPQSFTRVVHRVLTLRGVPSCASAVPQDQSDTAKMQQTLEACGIDLSGVRLSPDVVNGRVAADILERADRLLASPK
jgi:tetratricopeptide (TPR) repeat protein